MFSAQLLLLGVLLHRFASMSTPVATSVLGVGIVGALVSLLLAALSLMAIWRHGHSGAGQALVGTFVSLVILAGPAWYLPDLLMLPRINDVTTDPEKAPVFRALAASHIEAKGLVAYPAAKFAAKQTAAYPDIRPMLLERSPEETFDLVREAVKRLDWEVVEEQKPTETEPGRIEAVSHTLVMGYTDDVIIRVAPEDELARIDVRSASRYGEHDFGTNARRIRRLFANVKAGLEDGEQQVLEIVLARRAKEARKRAAILKKQREEEEKRQAALERQRERERRRIEFLQARRSTSQDASQSGAPGGQGPTGRRRSGGWRREPGRFFQQFGN
jgi:uncharacterized protein (DUF1499 family)